MFRGFMARMLGRSKSDRTLTNQEYREALNKAARQPRMNGHAPDPVRVREVMRGRR